MDEGFTAKPLGLRQIDQAYPLVRTIAPDLEVERWRGFATALTGLSRASGAPGGIMTAQNERGYIHGLFSYSVRADLHYGQVLAVDNFIVLDLFNPAGAASVLLKAMEDVARAHHCAAIHTALPERCAGPPDERHSMLGFFRDGGHKVVSPRLCKVLAGNQDNLSRPLSTVGDGGRPPACDKSRPPGAAG
ncbi:MAG TPA: hypothetical protein VGE72_04620 [Azospirillum sp.]